MNNSGYWRLSRQHLYTSLMAVKYLCMAPVVSALQSQGFIEDRIERRVEEVEGLTANIKEVATMGLEHLVTSYFSAKAHPPNTLNDRLMKGS